MLTVLKDYCLQGSRTELAKLKKLMQKASLLLLFRILSPSIFTTVLLLKSYTLWLLVSLHLLHRYPPLKSLLWDQLYGSLFKALLVLNSRTLFLSKWVYITVQLLKFISLLNKRRATLSRSQRTSTTSNCKRPRTLSLVYKASSRLGGSIQI